jgi:hypothetical protein
VKILCLLCEVGAARFLKPVFENWLRHAPDFEWRIIATSNVLQVFTGSSVADQVLQVSCERNETASAIELAKKLGWVPQAVLSSAGSWPSEFATVHDAKKQQYPVIQLIDTWYGYNRRFSFNGILQIPDAFMVLDEAAVKEAAAEGLPKEKLVPVGHPNWSTIKRHQGRDNRDTIFLGAPVLRDYQESLGYTEDQCWQMILDAKTKYPNLIGTLSYAPHPEQGHIEIGGNVRIVKYSPDMLEYTGQILGMFSAPMMDAYIAGRRVISIQPNAIGKDMCPFSRHGYMRRVVNMEEFVDALSSQISTKNTLDSLLWNSIERVTELCQNKFQR